MRSRATFAGCLVVTLAACAPQMNYAYQERLPDSAFGPPDTAEPAGREARQLLATARTVAFYPPDYCINVDKDEVARNRTLRANCGVLLSSLERAAEKAGYEVVSWQNLRGNQRPIDYAREAKVDVLFEINEFDFGPVDDAKLPRELGFTKWPSQGAVSTLNPTPDIVSRCNAYAASRRTTTTVAKVGTIDIKTVSVVDGRNRWRYRKSLTRPRGIQYETVAFGSRPKPNPGGVFATVFGGIGLATGAALLLISELSSDDPTTDTDERIRLGSVPPIMMVSGGLLLAGGIVLTALTTKPGGPEGMCASGLGVEPFVTPGNTPTVDEEAENAQIRSEMIGDFVGVLVEVRNTTPLPPPPPAPPAAPPPADQAPTAPAPAPAPSPTPAPAPPPGGPR